jgi:hypothetical protein
MSENHVEEVRHHESFPTSTEKLVAFDLAKVHTCKTTTGFLLCCLKQGHRRYTCRCHLDMQSVHTSSEQE